MTSLDKRLAGLSPEKRALLTQLLQKKRAATAQAQAIPRRPDPGRHPMSYAQQRLWFLDQFEPESPFYNISAALRLIGPLDAEALEQALNEIVARHEVLRANFTTEEGYPVQVVAPERRIPLPVTDLRTRSPQEQNETVQRMAVEEARRPFDLGQDPLLRVQLLRLDQEEYVLLLTMHHIISDGWSTGVLIQELSALYPAFRQGRPNPLPELPIQYADYAAWQQEWLQGKVKERQLAFWRETLGELPGPLQLPFDHPRPPVQTYRGAHHFFSIPQALGEKLMALAKAEDATLFMALLAAFQTLLHRYSGQEQIHVGTPVANRTRVELEPLIGFFVNTLVLPGRFPEGLTYRELLAQVRETALGAFAHQDLPFEMLVEELQPERDMSHTPLFQAMFDLQKAPPERFQVGDLELQLMEVETGTAKFDLLLVVQERKEGLQGIFEYNTDLFQEATIQRMAGHFRTLLEAITADPDQPIASLELLTPEERRRILVEWNDTAHPFPQDRTFHAAFQEQVTRTPHRTAVAFLDQQLSYAELNAKANQLAHFLRRQGVTPDSILALALERSTDMLVAILAILKAGAAYLPLDPTYPPARLQFMLEDAQASILLTQERLVEQLPIAHLQAPVSVVKLDADWPVIAQEPDSNPPELASPDSLAYVIYTSGSTGQPKGVLIQHRSMLHLATALHRIVYDGDDQLRRISLNAPISFDASVQQIVMLTKGYTLDILPNSIRQDSTQLLRFIRERRLDALDCVPSQLKLLLDAGLLDGSGWAPTKVLPGGEAIDPETWQRLRQAPATRFYNMYGPTECTVDSTIAPVHLAGDRPTIGRPVTNAQVFILDKHRQPVPVGVPGELYIGGAGVAKGYLNRPELTAERFVPVEELEFIGQEGRSGGVGSKELGDGATPDPLLMTPSSSRLYRTGDLARYLPDGNIEFLGRADHQIKIRGYRVEPGEIEAVLTRFPQVQEAVVLARTNPAGQKQLVAYFVPMDGAAEDGDTTLHASCFTDETTEAGPEATLAPPSSLVPDLRTFLKEHLPEYMVPAYLVPLERIPLTPNGKLDRRNLPEPDWSQRQLEGTVVPPRTATEEVLAGIWTQVLGVAELSVFDNFFELGGHSLLATQVISRIREAFQVELPLRTLFMAPTIAEQAEQVEIALRNEAGTQAPPIEPVPRDGPMPVSFAQQRLWFLDQLEPDSPFYNIPESVRLQGRLDVSTLEKAFNEIIRRHEILRTTIDTVDGRPVQRIHPEFTLELPVTDLTHLSQEEQEELIPRLAAEEAQKPFKLDRLPLLRARLLRLGPEDHVILLTIHHIIGDDWSTGVLIQEIAVLY